VYAWISTIHLTRLASQRLAAVSMLLVLALSAMAHPGAGHLRTQRPKVAMVQSLPLHVRLQNELREWLAESWQSKRVPARINLLSAGVALGWDRSTVTLNLSREVLQLRPGSAPFEDLLHALHHVAHDALEGEIRAADYVIEIEGEPLVKHLGFEQRLTGTTLAETVHATAAKNLAVRRVTISPGHGWYQANGSWRLQRSTYFGIVEDFINTEFVTRLNDYLVGEGAWVRSTRELNKSAGIGESNWPRWQEAARYFIKSKGTPETVWNSLASDDDLSDDIRARPLYANWRDGEGHATELIVSLHNNGGGGTGTETWYDTQNGFQVESRKLAEAVHTRIIQAIRSQFSASWVDRGVKGSAGGYGENRLATRPAILVEVAFMDTRSPDNDAMQAERFRDLVSVAIRDGIAAYLASKVDLSPPTQPEKFTARAVSARQIDLTWAPATDDTGVVAYRIRRDGQTLAAVTGLRYTDTGLVANQSYEYAISARDASGNWGPEVSLTSRTTAETPYGGMWWVPTESGWGLSITQHRDLLFAAIYSFGPDGQARWWVVPNCPILNRQCEGEVFQVEGGTRPSEPWNGSRITLQNAGTATLRFSDDHTAQFEWRQAGNRITRAIVRNRFAETAQTPQPDYSDLWWNASESGWGVALTQQSDTVFVAWYAFGSDGRASWLVGPSCRLQNGRCRSELYRVNGGSSLSGPWMPSLAVTPVGDLDISFTDASLAVMTYTIDGTSGSRTITRNPF
jgi:N-acetylmuramoyl-L-alanine amidase